LSAAIVCSETAESALHRPTSTFSTEKASVVTHDSITLLTFLANFNDLVGRLQERVIGPSQY